MATEETKVEFLKTRPEHKTQVGGVPYVCKHIAEQLKNGALVVDIYAYMLWENWRQVGICAGSPPDTSVGPHPTLTANFRFCVQLAGVSWMKTKTISWWKRKLMGAPLYHLPQSPP